MEICVRNVYFNLIMDTASSIIKRHSKEIHLGEKVVKDFDFRMGDTIMSRILTISFLVLLFLFISSTFAEPSGMVWVYIDNNPGVVGHEGFTG